MLKPTQYNVAHMSFRERKLRKSSKVRSSTDPPLPDFKYLEDLKRERSHSSYGKMYKNQNEQHSCSVKNLQYEVSTEELTNNMEELSFNMRKLTPDTRDCFPLLRLSTASTSVSCSPIPYRYCDNELFNLCLELYNRRGVRPLKKKCSFLDSVYVCEYYWESKGSVSATQQLCTACRDIAKARNCSDEYFIDLMEINMYRNILCKPCIGRMLKDSIGCKRESIVNELKIRRKEQGSNGLVVDPRLVQHGF